MAVARKTSGFWFAYLAAWTPYAVCYSAIGMLASQQPMRNVLASTLVTVAVAAALGLGVLALVERHAWPPRRRMRFAAVHAAGAPLYSIMWAAATVLVFSVESSLVAGRWRPVPWSGGWLYWQVLTGLLVYGTIASIAYALQAATRLGEERTRAERAEALRVQAELRALRSSLNPHFLFNTIHSVMALVRHDPQAAEDALEQFAGMLRYVLKTADPDRADADDVTLGEEWRFVQSYLELEKLRLGDRLRVEADVAPEALGFAVPVFTLQPLVENAVKHAIAPRASAGTVWISARAEAGDLRLEVRDDGPGADPAVVDASPGLGISAVRQRLDLRYKGRARFDVETAPERGFASTVFIPIDEGE